MMLSIPQSADMVALVQASVALPIVLLSLAPAQWRTTSTVAA